MGKFLTIENGEIKLKNESSGGSNPFQEIILKPPTSYNAFTGYNFSFPLQADIFYEVIVCICIEVKDNSNYIVNLSYEDTLWLFHLQEDYLNYNTAFSKKTGRNLFCTKVLSGFVQLNEVKNIPLLLTPQTIMKNGSQIMTINQNTELDIYFKVLYRDTGIVL